MNDITFIHTADLHLDSPFLSHRELPASLFERIQDSTFKALERLVDAAIDLEVDFVLMVGDLYDGEDRSIKAQSRLRKQLVRLQKANIRVFITHGNHDHLAGKWLTFDMPDNVYVFPSNVEMVSFETKNKLHVHVYGFSYAERHISDRKIEDYQKMGDADFHIGLLHGFHEGSSSDHYHYAPFRLHELLEKEMDYWALGHIHKRQILHHDDPFVVYPGNIQGRNRLESGEKGCYAVKLSANGNQELRFVPTAVIQWDQIQIDCSKINDLSTMFQQYHHAVQSLTEKKECSFMLEINLINTEHLSTDMKTKVYNGELLEVFQDQVDFNDDFIWPYQIHLKENKAYSGELLDQSFFQLLKIEGEKMKTNDSIERVLSELYSHPYASRYLNQLNEKDKIQLIEEAQNLILNRLNG